ncbi:MAG: sulfite exporter TauE/SafE family protein [Chloroflexi bacterium]|nr:MAG: sulfite exporter TauE/SafE family protein [Chloroflexota bacterium]
MHHLDTGTAVALAAAALVSGGVNAVAGGGSLISFPALLWAGYDPVVANITNAVALLPGYLGGTLGYRRELRGQWARARGLGAVSVAGAVLGSVLLLAGPAAVFSRIVPWLILFSCAVLAAQPAVARWLRSRNAGGGGGGGGLASPLLASQLLAAVYGSYFGAGLGVLTLALLGIFVDDGLQRLNALKGLLSLVINAVAVLCFVVTGRVAWAAVAIMAVASLVGGRAGVTLARRLDERVLRVLVIAFGVAVAVRLLL